MTTRTDATPASPRARRARRTDARQLHRWTMTVAVLLLAYWTISGLFIALYDATDTTQVWKIEGGGPGARLTDWARDAQPVPPPVQARAGIARAVASSRGMAIASADYRMTTHGPRLQLAEANGARDSERRFYAATGEPMTQAIADDENGAPPPPNVAWRNGLKAWHRGNVVGLPGQFLGLFAGIALIVLTTSGVLIYWRMWRARVRMGRTSPFWSARDTLWRRLHRSISIVAAVLVLNIAISGTVLAWGEIQLHIFLDHHIGFTLYPRPTPLPPVSDGTLGLDIAGALDRAYGVAQREGAIAGIDLVRRGDRPLAIVTLGGATPRTLALDARTGQAVHDWTISGVQRGAGYFADWHQVVKRIHRGDILGTFAARYLDIATGIALLYLVISGAVLYLDLRVRRRKPDWFWR